MHFFNFKDKIEGNNRDKSIHYKNCSYDEKIWKQEIIISEKNNHN